MEKQKRENKPETDDPTEAKVKTKVRFVSILFGINMLLLLASILLVKLVSLFFKQLTFFTAKWRYCQHTKRFQT